MFFDLLEISKQDINELYRQLSNKPLCLNEYTQYFPRIQVKVSWLQGTRDAKLFYNTFVIGSFTQKKHFNAS